MSTDTVKWLRDWAAYERSMSDADDMGEADRIDAAADELERLREALKDASGALREISSYAFEKEEFYPKPMFAIQDKADAAFARARAALGAQEEGE